MLDHITHHSVANAVRLKRSTSDGACIIVEGPSDKRFFSKIIDRDKCTIEIAHGRGNAINALKVLEDAEVPGIVAVLDADTWGLAGPVAENANIVHSDMHDVECMMLRSEATVALLLELGSEAKIRAFTRPDAVADVLAENCIPLGCLRLISLRDSYGLKFEGLDFSRFVSNNTLELDVDAMIGEVLNKSRRHGIASELKRKVTELMAEGCDAWQICCGHDITEILGLGLRRKLGSIGAAAATAEAIERNLRMAYPTQAFRSSQLFLGLDEWGKRNPGFQLMTC